MIGNVLQITTVPAKLDISTVKPYMVSSYIDPRLDIETTPANINIQSKNIKCHIDVTRCLAQEGDMTIGALTEQYAQEGIQHAKEAAHDATVDGDELIHAAPHAQGAVQSIIKQDFMGQQDGLGIKFIPSQGPDISWEKNQLNIDFQPSQLTYHWNVSTKPNSQFERSPSIDVTLTQSPSITIQYVGDTNTLHSLDQSA